MNKISFSILIFLTVFAFFSCSVRINPHQVINIYDSAWNKIEKASGEYEFSSVLINTSITETFIVQNTGCLNLRLLGNPKAAVSGSGANAFNVTLQPEAEIKSNENTKFQISFSPPLAQHYQATVTILSNDKDSSPYVFSISGSGLAPEINVKQGSVTILSDSGIFNFGNMFAGDSTSDIAFTIENIGTEVLKLVGNPKIAISGIDSDMFIITQNDTSEQIQPGNSTSFTIKFKPLSMGEKSATIQIPNNDVDEDPYMFTIEGSAFETTPLIGSFSFGSHIKGAGDVAYENNTVFVGKRNIDDRTSSISALNVTNITNIFETSEVITDVTQSSIPGVIEIWDKYLVVGNNRFSSCIIDKSNTDNLILTDSLYFGRSGHALKVLDDDYYFISTGWASSGEMRTIKWSDPHNISEVNKIAGLNHPGTISYIAGNYLFTVWKYCSGTPGLRIYDITNPASPNEVGTLVLEYHNCCVVGDRSTAYVASDNNLYKIDVNNVTNPIIVETIDYDDYTVWDMMKMDDYILVSKAYTGLYIYKEEKGDVKLIDTIKPTSSECYFVGIDVDKVNKRIFVLQGNSTKGDVRLLVFKAFWL